MSSVSISLVGEGGEAWLEVAMREFSFEGALQGDGGLGIGVGLTEILGFLKSLDIEFLGDECDEGDEDED
ncbi:hypothetical protein Tco_1372614 [Tanacetum coccineum]